MTTFKLNSLTRSQKQARGREMRRASVAAMKAYFRGDGSLKRITRFLFVFLLYFIFWTVVATSVVFTVLLVSDALFIAPGYTYLFDHIDFHAGLSPVFSAWDMAWGIGSFDHGVGSDCWPGQEHRDEKMERRCLMDMNAVHDKARRRSGLRLSAPNVI
jgi:hypothetical protein